MTRTGVMQAMVLLAGLLWGSMAAPATAADHGGDLVLLVVEENVQPEIEAEVNRLKTDLAAENYTAKTHTWTGGSATDLWDVLVAEYNTEGQTMVGAILIGNLPLAKNSSNSQTTDKAYWNMDTYGAVFADHIWVSRIAGLTTDQEIRHIKQSLDTNHYYRTGQSRLPHSSFYLMHAYPDSEPYYYPRDGENALDVWPAVAKADHGLVYNWTVGGEMLDETMHGSALSGCVRNLRGHPSQIRFNLITSCSTSKRAQELQISRGGGCVFGVGATTTTYTGAFVILQDASNDVNFRAKLAAGESWGEALVYSYAFSDSYRAMYWGDLSIGAKASGTNTVPAVDSFTADVTSGVAPLTVQFTASASDPGGSISLYEWFTGGYQYGTVEPTHSGSSLTSVSHTYTRAHRYMPEVDVMDNYRARAWSDMLTITVGPTPGQPLRMNCGRILSSNYSVYLSNPAYDYTDGSGKVWLHDQTYAAGTWGYQTSRAYQGEITVDIAGTDDDVPYAFYRTATADYPYGYRVPMGNGRFKVTLGFAEPDAAGVAGTRLVDVNLEGRQWLVGYDIVAEAGGATRTAVTTFAIVEVTDGELTIDISRNPGSFKDGIVSWIKVEPDSSPNQSPVIASYSPATPFSMDEGATQEFLVNASDSDGDKLSYVWMLDDVVVQGARTASWTYEPDHYQAGAHTIQVWIDDWRGGRVTQIWAVEVLDVNGPPDADDQEVQTLLATAVGITLTATDPDGDPMTFAVVDGPAHGTLSGTAPNLTYTPEAGYEGHDLFTFRASDDGANHSDPAEVKLRVGVPGEVIVEGRDQHGVEVAGAEIYVRELGIWYPTGTKLTLTVGNTYRFKGRVRGITGPEISKVIADTTHEVTTAFWESIARARDQHGADVANAQIYVRYATDSPYAPGTAVTLPANVNVNIYGRVPNVSGPQTLIAWRAGLDEVAPAFWTATLVARDQHGSDVPNATVRVRYLDPEYYSPGTAVTLPKGYNAITQGKVPSSLIGPYVYFVFTGGLTEVNPGFQTFTVKCRDQHNNVVPGAQGHVRYYDPEYHADGTVLTVPRDDSISVRSRRATLYASAYDLMVFGAGVNEFNAKFRSVLFKAVATNGTTVVPGAEIEIYGSGLARFANNTAQGLPYDDTIRVKVRKDTVLIADVSTIAIDATTSTLIIATSWVATENTPPTIESVMPTDDPVEMALGATETFEVFASDIDGDDLTYSWEIDSVGTGVTESSMDYTPGAAGGHTVKVTVSDGRGGSVNHTWNVTVKGMAVTKGLSGIWSFEEGSGVTAADGSGNGNDGTLSNGPVWVSGKEGGALQFDGVDDRVLVPDAASLNPASAVSVACWVKSDTEQSGRAVLMKGTGSSYDYMLYFSGGPGVAFYLSDTAGSRDAVTAGFDYTDNEWHHYAGVFDGEKLKLYVDGVLVKSKDTALRSVRNSGYNLQLMEGWNGNFKGSLDEMRIYGRGLSASEVAELAGGLDAGVGGHWSFEEGSGVTAADGSGNGNDGTLSNGPVWVSGKEGGALQFDGVDDRVLVPDAASLNPASAVSVACWVKSDTEQSGRAVLMKGTGSSYDYMLYFSGGPGVAFYLSDTAGSRDAVTAGFDYTDNEWHHYAGVFDGEKLKLYVDGVLVKSKDTALRSVRNSGYNLQLMEGWNGNFKGSLDEMRIYGRGLSASEVAELAGGLDAGVGGHWSFEEGSGVTAADGSGNGNDGTLSNGPVWVSGKEGGALQFDGVDDRVLVPDAASLNPASAVSVACWVKSDTEQSGRAVLMKGTGSSYDYMLYFSGGPGVAFYLSDTAGSRDAVTAGFDYTDNEWHHYAGVFDGEKLKLYVDGVLVKSKDTALRSVRNSGYNLQLMEGWNGNFKGSLDEMRIYGRGLSASEVAELAHPAP